MTSGTSRIALAGLLGLLVVAATVSPIERRARRMRPGPDLHGNAIGTVYWTQGHCMLLISLEVEGPRVERLAAGVTAIYERTGDTCPD